MAATPGSPFPVSHAVTVTRAKSAVQTSTPKPVDVRAKQLMVPATPKVCLIPFVIMDMCTRYLIAIKDQGGIVESSWTTSSKIGMNFLIFCNGWF